jgi:hypothetical protein
MGRTVNGSRHMKEHTAERSRDGNTEDTIDWSRGRKEHTVDSGRDMKEHTIRDRKEHILDRSKARKKQTGPETKRTTQRVHRMRLTGGQEDKGIYTQYIGLSCMQ